jgi:chloride channel protein, CIC family
MQLGGGADTAITGYGRKIRRQRVTRSDRQIMLIGGAAAGLAAVFRAPFSGLIFVLEMPFRDDLAHEALLPSLISSVVAYATLVAILGSEPLFAFNTTLQFHDIDLVWAALLGLNFRNRFADGRVARRDREC